MADFNLDRIRFKWKGTWSTASSYTKDDIVYYEGKAYVCLEGHTSSATDFYNDRDAAPTQTIEVTVGTDTLNSRTHGVFYLDGVESPALKLRKGNTYIFDQTDLTNKDFGDSAHPLMFSIIENGTLNGASVYETNVVYYIDDQIVSRSDYLDNFITASSRKIQITIADNVQGLYYFSSNELNMGNSIRTAYSSYWELMFDGYTWKGDWAIETFYPEGAIVKFYGYIYRCINSHTSTVQPNPGLITDSLNWTLYATTYNWLNTWTVSTNYSLGDVVRYNGVTYICNNPHLSNSLTLTGLEDDQSKWTIVTRSDNWRGNWTTFTRYLLDDIVKYGGIVYRCVIGHTSNVSATLGLETDVTKWEVVNTVIEYKGTWAPATRYKEFDVVKYGGGLWIATSYHTSATIFRTDVLRWNAFVPGFEYETVWDPQVEYNTGDIVLYGGYSYTALTDNINSVPSVNGAIQDTGDWELLTTGYTHRGDWDNSIDYLTGDVIRQSGYLYIALVDSNGLSPNTHPTEWQLLTTGSQWRSDWVNDTTYYLGDVTTIAGTAYQCILGHLSSVVETKPTTDVGNTDTYWIILIQGSPSNVLTTQGDIRYYNSAIDRLPIGAPGNALKGVAGDVAWADYGTVTNVFYVSVEGEDIPTAGILSSAPFRTVKYACEYVQANVNTDLEQSTIFIKTGYYEEVLPIKVPRNCALVGDELRSTIIAPATAYETSNMFYVNNGSGIRNMTLQGLNGTLGPTNQYLTRRPTAGAFVSLDPGTGPGDNTVWIINKSPYVQNVSTFGTGCIGMKIDGALHSDGNRSIVANDFTQILSDGIGYWASAGGRSELVSVFTYFCHIGYLADDGGVMRATNGNNSYGEYGSVAEGFNLTEVPITGVVNNRSFDAQVGEIFTYGTTEQKIIAIGYSSAGEEYTTADIDFAGSGINAAGTYSEFRNNAVTQVRVISAGDSSIPGGLNYTRIINSAQSGTTVSIDISQADIGTAEEYIGQRIVIISGVGVGQYGEITDFDETSKTCIISRESDGSAGWDHFMPGWPISTFLDETTRYSIEPRVVVDEPTFNVSTTTAPVFEDWKYIVYGSNWVAVTAGGGGSASATTSSTGTTWTGQTSLGTVLPTGLVWTGSHYLISLDGATDSLLRSSNGVTWDTITLNQTASTGWISIASDGNGTAIAVSDTGLIEYSTNNGLTWTTGTTVNRPNQKIVYGKGIFVLISDNGYVNYTDDNGVTWTEVAPLAAGFSGEWTKTGAVYGNQRFVVVGIGTGASIGTNYVARSFDGIEWTEETSAYEWTNVSYGAGVFIASGETDRFGKSQSGEEFRTFGLDSTVFSSTVSGQWGGSAYHEGTWIVVNAGSPTWNRISTGATAIIRASISNSRIAGFLIYDPGSNYLTTPTLSLTDNQNTIDTSSLVRMGSGVLAQPDMSNRGTGYFTATATITGDGYADIYQLNTELVVSNVTRVPGPGDNLNIAGIDDAQYSVTRVISLSGAGPYELVLQITPPLGIDESPDHNASITIRQQYSQIRLTGHDFLDIGVGNVNSARYPQLYLEGEDPESPRQPFNETVAVNGGRVFYTSTDQDGNFRVGELFQVEQNTGIVSINASQFNLSGLSELSLGGIQVGGSTVVIREFSKEDTFVANSNNIVPTQKAIISYLNSRISGGGSNANTNRLIAGQIQIDTNAITTTSRLQVNVPTKANITKGMTGHYLASQFYAAGTSGVE